MTDLSLDAGALIALERGDPKVRGHLRRAFERGAQIHVVPEVVAQSWRGGPRQAAVAQLLTADEVEIPAYDGATARAVGHLCGVSGHSDVVDVHVVLHARLHRQVVLTSDPDDLRAIDPDVATIAV
jgi:hypothetical protein